MFELQRESGAMHSGSVVNANIFTMMHASHFMYFSRGPALVLLALVAALCQGCTNNISNADIKPISLIEVREAMASGKEKAILIVDARSGRAFAEGHIPGAVNISIASVSEREPTRDKRIEAYKVLAVYGDDPGSPAAQAMTKRFMILGYDDVRMFMDGLAAWRRAGLKVEQGGTGALPVPAAPGVKR